MMMIKILINEYRWRLFFATVINSASSFASIGLLALINSEINTTVNTDNLADRVTVFVVAVFALFVISFASQFYLTKLGATLVRRLRAIMLERILRTDFARLEEIGGHKIYATLTGDINRISLALSTLPLFFFNLSLIVLCFGYFAYLSVPYFLMLSAVVAVILVVSRMMLKRGVFYMHVLREREDELFRMFQTVVEGSKELNINGNRRKHFYEEQALPSMEAIRETDVKSNLFWNLNNSWSATVLFVCLGVLVFSAKSFMPVTNEVLVGFVLGITYLVGPFAVIMTSFQNLSQGLVAYKKINKFELADLPEKGRKSAAISAPDLKWGKLTLNHIYYQYHYADDDYEFSVGPVDLTIEQGEIIFFCGGNGSGKSTFAKLLVGLYKPEKGEAVLGGVHINEDNLSWYQSHFSTVFSDFYLFDRVLDERGGLAEDSVVEEYLEKLQLQDKLESKGGVLSSIDFSHGQKKRLALLLAYVENASIYVFDEWAADQDPYFRKYFYTRLLPELKARGKTVIVISHDDKYFYMADKLYQFDNGMMSLIPRADVSVA